MKALVFLLFVAAAKAAYIVADDPYHKFVEPASDLSIYNFERDARILNGSNAQPGQFPFTARVSIVRTNPDGSTSGGTCSGSLIRTNFAISASHCVTPNTHLVSNVGFLVGTVNRNQPGGLVINSAEFWWMQQPATLVQDLSMFRLERHLEFSSLIGAIALPPPEKDHLGPVTLIGEIFLYLWIFIERFLVFSRIF